MKPTTIDVQITKCPKQYEAVRIGMQATLDPEETVESSIKAATAQLNSLYVEMYQTKVETPQNEPKTAKTDAGDKREILKFEDERVQQIVNRIDKVRGDATKVDEILKQVNKYYVLDANAQKAIDVAAQISKKNIITN